MELVWFMPLYFLWLPLLALVLDLLLGDPQGWPHPVNLVGRLLSGLQRPLLRLKSRKLAGGALALGLALLLTALCVLLLLNLPFWLLPAGLPGRALGGLVAVYLCFAGLALGCLLREGARARQAIDRAPASSVSSASEDQALTEARRAVSMLVSRDVSGLDKPALYRTLAETLSENFNDAFVAPFFWLLLGGPVGLWMYKCASTADSRWGYRHEPWTLTGRAAARLDDVLAFVPARISAFIMYVCRDRRGACWPGWRVLRRDAAKMDSPNAGWSMAAAAWLHGAGMGGPAVYAGKVKEKPWLGPERAVESEWNAERIDALIRHLRLSGCAGALLMWLLLALLPGLLVRM